MSHPVSGYIIARSEPRSLPAAIECILPYVDDLLLIVDDCGLIPNDPKIRYVDWPQTGPRYDFSEPLRRTWAMQACLYPWILTIDGDELLTDREPDFYRNITEPLAFPTYNLLDESTYITENRLGPDPIPWYPDPHVRYFHRDDFVFENLPRHGRLRLKGSGRDAIYCSAQTDVHVWHYHNLVKNDWHLDQHTEQFTVAPLTEPQPKAFQLIKTYARQNEIPAPSPLPAE